MNQATKNLLRCMWVSTIVMLQSLLPTTFTTNDSSFSTWNDTWQLPAPGEGTIYFTVTPASGETLHDINFLFSPVKAVAGVGSGGVDADNFWLSIGAIANQATLIVQGMVSPQFFWYWRQGILGEMLSAAFQDFPPLPEPPSLPQATTDVAYDFMMTIDASKERLILAAKISGATVYEELFRYTGMSFPVPANARYFSFAAFGNTLTFSNIEVTTVPSTASFLLDGRKNMVYVDNHYTFSDGQCAFGRVFFNDGFTVPAGATVYLDINQPVGGPINLNETGKLVLGDTLRLSPLSQGFTNGGIIATADGEAGMIVFDSPTVLTKELIFQSSMDLELNGFVLQLSSYGDNRGAIVIDNTISQTITIHNGIVRGVEDFTTGYRPRLRANAPLAGRHGYKFSDVELQFYNDGTMTVTGSDIIFQGFNNKIMCNVESLAVLGQGLYINQLTQLLLTSGIELRLDSNLTSGYFAIDNGSAIALQNATFSYAQPLTIPSPSFTRNMISTIVAQQGRCKIKALGSGDQRMLTIGGGTFYNYDTQIDIYPQAQLLMDNMLFINNNNRAQQ